MENLKLYKKQIQEIESLINKLDQGKLALSELTELENLTRALHEKSIILKYKAMEESVGISPIVSVPSIEEVVEPEIAAPEKVVVPEVEQPTIDFSIFGDSSEISDETPEVKQEETIVKEPEVEIEETVGITTTEDSKIIEKETTITVVKEEPSSVLDKMAAADNSINSKFHDTKITSLIGAFSLNEKLRFINDLFDGSSELFSEAIKVLDNQPDFEAAQEKSRSMSNEHTWEDADETAAEFMNIVKRRYA